MLRQNCPSCAATLELPATLVGKRARCPACREVFTFDPAAGESPPSGSPPSESGPGGSAAPDRPLGVEGWSTQRPAALPLSEKRRTPPPIPSPFAGPRGEGAAASPPPVDPLGTAPQRRHAPPDPNNPYAFDSAALGARDMVATERGPIRIVTASIDDIISCSTSIFTARWQALLVGGVILFAAYFGTSILNQIVPLVGAAIDPAIGMAISGVTQLLTNLLMWYLTLGLTRIALRTARGEIADVSHMFPPLSLLVQYIFGIILLGVIAFPLAALFVGLIVALVALIGMGMGAGGGFPVEVGLIGGFLILLPLVFGIQLLFWPWYFVICDERARWFEALKIGFRIAIVNKVNTLLMFLIAVALGIVGVLMCCVGSIITTPATMLVGSVAYLLMTSQPVHDPARGLVGLPLPTATPS